ncbi:MAG: lactate racemase domain-containing protein [Chloroflexota bacterium]
MGISAQATAPANTLLAADDIRETLETGLAGEYSGKRVLILIPDHTRTIPLPQLFRMLADVLHDAAKLDYMVALGTHPPLDEAALLKLVGLTADEKHDTYGHINIYNHAWDAPHTLTTIGTITQDEVKAIAGDLWHHTLGGDVDIRINRHIYDYDHVLILGPTFPHEVVGYSGGAKYLFPGISGADMINVTHWLGALATVLGTIGIKDTPVREMIHRAAERVAVPVTLIGLVVEKDGLAGMFIGDHISAWHAAADLSSQRHVVWVDEPYQQVMSVCPPMYDELWTGAKAMYKTEPAVADGGEVIVYAPHLDVVSFVHGAGIYEAGYHIRDFYLKQWETYGHLPLGVLAHGTHLRGSGTYENGIEYPRINVTLASQISADDCARLNLGYMNPDEISMDEWADRENEGVLLVKKAGEMLYRVRE